LLHAALAIQARLLLTRDDGRGRSADGKSSPSAAAAAAMLKAFQFVAAAPLTHPLPHDEDWRVISVGRGDAQDGEPLAAFVGALLSSDDADRPRLLQQVAAARFGSQVNAKIDVDNAWWSSAPLLMQARDSSSRQAQPNAHRTLSSHSSAADNAAPRHKFVCRNVHVTCCSPSFAWPSHHYSATLAAWGSSGLLGHALQVHAQECICAIVTTLDQPTPLLLSRQPSPAVQPP